MIAQIASGRLKELALGTCLGPQGLTMTTVDKLTCLATAVIAHTLKWFVDAAAWHMQLWRAGGVYWFLVATAFTVRAC